MNSGKHFSKREKRQSEILFSAMTQSRVENVLLWRNVARLVCGICELIMAHRRDLYLARDARFAFSDEASKLARTEPEARSAAADSLGL